MIALNWLLFIASVQQGRALEASLGYYIFPLLAVALGFLFLGERFTRLQRSRSALAALAVVVLTLGQGAAPWTALAIAATFAAYGLIKTRVRVGPVVSVFVETLLLAPLALVWLWGMHSGAWTDLGGRSGGAFGRDWATSAMLALSGPLTGGPLMLFAYAARRIPYATLGLVQYLNPTLQFAVAVALFGEPFTAWHAVAFGADLDRARALLLGEAGVGPDQPLQRGEAPPSVPAPLSRGSRNSRKPRSAKPCADQMVEQRAAAGPSSRRR